VTRPRLAYLQRVAQDLTRTVRHRHRRDAHRDDHTSAELARRLDATRERLRREIPPPAD
jgi:hypothetical protein